MMRLKLILLIAIFLVGAVAFAQEDTCDVDTSNVMNVVEGVCTGIGRDEVCYGNFEVNLILQDDAPDLTFENPGDMASLASVRSLFLSALDPVADIWGIAQMRLLANTSQGSQDVTLLLFGDVSVENAVESTTILSATVGRFSANIRNVPSSSALVLASMPAGTVLEAVGRLEDSSWIRVRVPDSASVGWIAAELINPTNADESFALLAVQNGNTPYYGPMQAFYYSSGNSSACSNVVSDGLLIQTPEGVARVTLLINEVSIEFIGGQNGASAFIQANPEQGMTVNMIDGTAYVQAGGTSYFVDSTMQTTIPLDENLAAAGTPSAPDTYDIASIQSLALLPVIRDPSLPIVPSTSTDTDSTNTSTGGGGGGGGNATGNATGRGNATGNANGNANGRNR